MKNALVQGASDLMNAYGAVRKRLPPHSTEPHPEGLTIALNNGLDLLITHEAARQFRQIQEEERT